MKLRVHMPERSGFSLVELLVVLGVIAMLAGLLLPAVQSSRESARRAECQSRMKQIGIALAAHASTYGTFPFVAQVRGPETPPPPAIGLPARCYSPFVALLPYLENSVLHSGYNFHVPASGPPSKVRPERENETVARVVVASFLCPSDATRMGEWGGTNFRYSGGQVSFRDSGSEVGAVPISNVAQGAFVADRALSPAEFPDGLSSTVFVSEKIRGGDDSNFVPSAGFWYSNALPQSQTELIEACGALRGVPGGFCNEAGASWTLPNNRFSSYGHDLPPNSAVPDCSVAWNDREVGDTGCFTARSRHPHGVDVLYGDGHVTWVRDGIATSMWRALGTRNGSEILDSTMESP